MPELDVDADEFGGCLFAPLPPEPEEMVEVAEHRLLALSPELIGFSRHAPG